MPDETPIDVNDPDYDDPIIAEIRQIREEMAAEWNYDLSLMVQWFEEQQRLDPIEGLIDCLPSTPVEPARRNA
ncbi:MAG: hypothetical protein AVDCRST_MAG68-2602 [uncultured Gemmatimonadetes bacterium]|uniref:Uncharacterized protein n=1 Tax=uncultured Gemmatimonadota bacterium TaxID=203437 RepID=A0A6J4LJC5_9BACT|nr:MAG: hypothetical protein AVDCRST_MAG68-2602 [uncultured Gemmatimonadota bacterium]